MGTNAPFGSCGLPGGLMNQRYNSLDRIGPHFLPTQDLDHVWRQISMDFTPCVCCKPFICSNDKKISTTMTKTMLNLQVHSHFFFPRKHIWKYAAGKEFASSWHSLGVEEMQNLLIIEFRQSGLSSCSVHQRGQWFIFSNANCNTSPQVLKQSVRSM